MRSQDLVRLGREDVRVSAFLGGIHYMSSNLIGAEQGRCIARTVLARVHTRKGASQPAS